VARVFIRGGAAKAGVTGWEARFEASDNLVIDGIDLVDGSVNLGADGDFVVGFGEARRAAKDGVQVATVRFHVTDDRPAALSLVPATRSSVGGAAPAVVAADGTADVVAAGVQSFQDGAAAVINLAPDRQVPPTVALDLRTVPNPFNPSTEIKFNLPKAGLVELRIYDMRGRLVFTARPGAMPAGAQSVAWNGVDRRGGGVTSGVYFYQLFLDGQKLGSSGKMTLLK
jgi:hypothetical protein